MGLQHAWRAQGAGPRRFGKQMAKRGFDIGPCNRAWPQQTRRVKARDDRRFKANLAAAAIEDEVDF
jgi:hypothetical protein